MNLVSNLCDADSAVLDALKARLAALQWTPPSGPAQALFARVEIFPQSQLVDAVRQLVAMSERVCLVVLTGEDWETDPDTGRHRKFRQRRSVTLLLCDRNWGGNWQVAMLGRATTPYACGALTMKGIVLQGEGSHPGVLAPALTSRTWCEPERGDFVVLADGTLPGVAICWSMDLAILGGSLQTNLPQTLMP